MCSLPTPESSPTLSVFKSGTQAGLEVSYTFILIQKNKNKNKKEKRCHPFQRIAIWKPTSWWQGRTSLKAIMFRCDVDVTKNKGIYNSVNEVNLTSCKNFGKFRKEKEKCYQEIYLKREAIPF